MARFPKRTRSAAKGETGVNLVSLAVNEELKWIFRRTHNEHDFGIDGYIDIVEDDGAVTGRSISVQIKCGSSFFKESDEYGITFRGDNPHLNYLLNHPTPTIIIICDPGTKVCYWEQLTPERTQGTGEGWKISVPRAQTLDLVHKARLREVAGEATDVVQKLEEYWAVNRVVAEAGAIIYTIDRSAIEGMDTSEASEFFERIRATRELAVQTQDKVTLHVWGYDSDERELWEIPEVRRWFRSAEPIIKYWFYHLRNSSERNSLMLLAACVCSVKRRRQKNQSIEVEFDKDDLRAFILRNFSWLNELTDHLGLSIEDNKRLSFNAMDVLKIPHS